MRIHSLSTLRVCFLCCLLAIEDVATQLPAAVPPPPSWSLPLEPSAKTLFLPQCDFGHSVFTQRGTETNAAPRQVDRAPLPVLDPDFVPCWLLGKHSTATFLLEFQV